MAARTKALAIGSAGWVLEEHRQSNQLLSQELEDFGFTIRNELEWLSEHMADIFASNTQHNLDVFKTPGKLRGKTPRTARKKKLAEPRQPLVNILPPNAQTGPSLAEQSLKSNLQKQTNKARFQIAEDATKISRVQSPVVKIPVARQLFSKPVDIGKENVDNSFHAQVHQEHAIHASWSPAHSIQDVIMTSQEDDIFSVPPTQSTQQTQQTQSTQAIQSFCKPARDENERRDSGESYVSANEAFGSKNPSKEGIFKVDDALVDGDDAQVDLSRSDTQDTMIHHKLGRSSEVDTDSENLPTFPVPSHATSEQHGISDEMHARPSTANTRVLIPEPNGLYMQDVPTMPARPSPALPYAADARNEAVAHHDADDAMDIDDVRSPSDGSSPVKPLVRKSSLTFASLPAREPLLSKKSMGNRISRTSHIDSNKARSSHLGRFTDGKSLGGYQITQPADLDVDMDRIEARDEEFEAARLRSKTSTQRLHERIKLLKQKSEAFKRISQNVPQPQAQSLSTTQSKEDAPCIPSSQPTYPQLNTAQGEDVYDDDDWISPVRMAPAPSEVPKPPFVSGHTADSQSNSAISIPLELPPMPNTNLSAVIESTTPVGSPSGKKYMDGPLSASKSKLYSAFRAAKEKLIGSSATSAQAKLDALGGSPKRPVFRPQESSEDVFTSPKRAEKASSVFPSLRSPSKESQKSSKSGMMPDSPVKNASRRTRSSAEREKQKEKEIKELKHQQRAEERLRDMREKEHSKATIHHQKTKLTAKALPAISSQSNLKQSTMASTSVKTSTMATLHQQTQSHPAAVRVASKDQDMNSADEMPPPPPPKSLLTSAKTTKAALREPKKLLNPTSKEALSKTKAPQKIMVNLNSSRYNQAPPPAARPAPGVAVKPLPPAPQAAPKSVTPATKPVSTSSLRPTSTLSTKPGPSSKMTQAISKTAAQRAARAQAQAAEKLKATAMQPRADLGTARPVSRMQTVQDANRVNIPPVNPAKPPKRPLQGEGDETLHRPAKRPSQQARLNPVTPAHAQFAKGKIPFAEAVHAPQSLPTQTHYPHGEDVKLPEIMTDSEDEDSENEFQQPSWVNTPNLREMLASQQLMDPETIFGPIAPLEMEKMFPNKERHKRFRERTSSAYWANDQITEEERRKEREARERLARDGAWTYNPSPGPTPSSLR